MAVTLLFLVLGCFESCGGVYCHFCISPRHYVAEHCALSTECPKGSPGCVTIDVEEADERYVIRSCSFPEKCNDTVLSYRGVKDSRIISCEFCKSDFCNSRSTSLTDCVLLLVLSAFFLFLR